MDKRLFTLLAFVIVAFAIDVAALFSLQIFNREKYQLLSEKNRIRVVALVPKRGEIVDRNNTKLAYNVPTYKLSVINNSQRDVISKYNEIVAFFKKDIADISQILDISKKLPRHAYVTIKDNLSWNEYVNLAINNLNQNGIILEQDFSRRYSHPSYSHLIGYISQAESNSLLKSGKQGLEKYYNDFLQGVLGNRKIEINSSMRLVRQLDTVPAINGNCLKLTIDDRYQKIIYQILSKAEAASCVLLNIKTGEILACVSIPSFDQNILTNGVSNTVWDSLISNKYHPLNDRVFKSAYSPGSVFKIFVAYAALKSGVITPNEKIFCPGYYKIGKDRFHCWNRGGHGHISLKNAIASSCDVYFFEISKRLGIDKLANYAKLFGFGENVCTDIPFTSKGIMPSKEWKRAKYDRPWQTYETILTGIGQGSVLVTALQLAVATARLWTNNLSLTAKVLATTPIPVYTEKQDRVIKAIQEAMISVCESPYGTATSVCNAPYGIAGKTGSAQVRRLKQGEHGAAISTIKWEERDHGLFVAVAPYKTPKYCLSVILEHGGSGTRAATIARTILDKIIAIEAENG